MRLLHTSFGIQNTGWITEEKVIQPGLFFRGQSGDAGLLRQDERSDNASHPDRVTREPSLCHTLKQVLFWQDERTVPASSQNRLIFTYFVIY